MLADPPAYDTLTFQVLDHLLHHSCIARLLARLFNSPGADSADGQLQIELPPSLQKQLLDQYDAIHEDSKLLQLPRRPNVMQVSSRLFGSQSRAALQTLVQTAQPLIDGMSPYIPAHCVLFTLSYLNFCML